MKYIDNGINVMVIGVKNIEIKAMIKLIPAGIEKKNIELCKMISPTKQKILILKYFKY